MSNEKGVFKMYYTYVLRCQVKKTASKRPFSICFKIFIGSGVFSIIANFCKRYISAMVFSNGKIYKVDIKTWVNMKEIFGHKHIKQTELEENHFRAKQIKLFNHFSCVFGKALVNNNHK